MAKRDAFFIEHHPRRDYDVGRGEVRAGITGRGDCGREKCDDGTEALERRGYKIEDGNARGLGKSRSLAPPAQGRQARDDKFFLKTQWLESFAQRTRACVR